MGRGKRAAGNKAPLGTYHRCRNVLPRTQQDAYRYIVRVIARDGKHAALRRGKAAITDTWVGGDDNCNAARHCSIKQAFQKSVARSAETQVDHLGILVESEVQRLRQGKAAANRRIGAPG